MAARVFQRLAQLLDVAVTSPGDGEVLTYSGTSAKWENQATGGGGGALPDPITVPLNVATTDASKVPLKFTLPVGFDLGAYDAIEIENSDGLRLFSLDVGGSIVITANPTLGVPAVLLGTDGSNASITLSQGSDTADTGLSVRPGAGHAATFQVANVDGTEEHTLTATAAGQTAGQVGFYGHAPVTLQTGVAVNAGAIHAALVNLGLITA